MKNGIALAFQVLAFLGCASTMATTTNSGAATQTTLFARYDRIKGRTDVSTIVFIRTGGMFGHPVELDLVVEHADTVLRRPLPGVVMLFKSSSGTQSQGWQFLRNHDLAILVDDTTRMTYQGARESDVGTVVLRENIGFVIPTTDLLRIGNSRQVDGRLGNWDFSLQPDEIAKVRELALFASMNPDAPRPKRGRDR